MRNRYLDWRMPVLLQEAELQLSAQIDGGVSPPHSKGRLFSQAERQNPIKFGCASVYVKKEQARADSI